MSDLIRRDDVVNLLAEHFTGLKDDLIIPLSFFPSPIDYFRGLINQIPTAEPKEYVKDGTLTVQMPTIKEAKAVDKIVVYADTYKQEYFMPKVGKRKIEEMTNIWGKGYRLTCLECGDVLTVIENALPYEKYCPNCGAKMERRADE